MIERLVTTTEAAELLGVPATMIAVWKARNRVVPADWIHGRGPRRTTPLYRLSDLQPLADEYHWRTSSTTDTPPSSASDE